MEMQDKEFDRLFNSKFNDLEVEPSAEVWQNITRELNGEQTKRSIIPYLSIAASVMVLASVSLWFFNRTNKKVDQPPVKLATHIKPVKPLSAADNDTPTVALKEIEDDTYLKKAALAAVESQKATPNITTQMQEIKQETTAQSPEITTQKKEPVLAGTQVEKPTLLLPVAPATEIEVGTTLVNQPKPISETPELFITDPIPGKNHEKKRARGLGGLFNTIIAAVDKREDKLLEFTDAGNDEGTRVTGVNLGIFKIKKQ